MSTFSLEVPGGWVTAIVLALGFLAAIALDAAQGARAREGATLGSLCIAHRNGRARLVCVCAADAHA